MSLKSSIESVLFVSLKPLNATKLASICNAKAADVEIAIKELKEDYKNREAGLLILETNGSYQLSTSPDNSEMLKDYLKDETSGELSQPSLEALTIIAYRGPIAKSELEKIRGINCSLIIRNLLLRGLIEENFDKKISENRYFVSHDFLRHLGISNVNELPDFEKLNSLQVIDRYLTNEESA